MRILDKYADLQRRYETIKDLGGDPFGVVFSDIKSPVEGVVNGKSVLILGSNNYLGMTCNAEVIVDGIEALRKYGSGMTGSRIANGSHLGHELLERRLAVAVGKSRAMVFSTGYLANLGTISALVGPGDHVLIDADSHASIYDGCRLATGEIIRFRHNDPDDLAKRLNRLKGSKGARLVVVEGIYSMQGDRAPLAEIAAVKREIGAYLLVDEAHSFGVLGATGRGAAEEAGVLGDVDFVVGTFSKSLGGVGGFCASDIDDFDVLRLVCRPYMFTASLSPSMVASTIAALDQAGRNPGLRQRLNLNAHRLYEGLRAAGFILGSQVSPIVAIHMPDTGSAVAFWAALLERGVYVNLALPPATPTPNPLLRTSVTAAHTLTQIDQAIGAITAVGKQLKMIGV